MNYKTVIFYFYTGCVIAALCLFSHHLLCLGKERPFLALCIECKRVGCFYSKASAMGNPNIEYLVYHLWPIRSLAVQTKRVEGRII